MKKILRIIDANLNRAREGLRVCEDISRFAMPEKPLAGLLKTARHSATRAVLSSKNLTLKDLVGARDVKNDCMKFRDSKRSKGDSLPAVFMANIERVKESLRVLEECSKVMDETVSHKYRKIRFDVYEIEKKYNDSIRIRKKE
ncbi:MAG: thiamine-phosphate pyrophosphorylase [Candidatus Omnitrophica bacterium]|nr:thiamine-phosphate pyrophosphorylase [Candidatus Omnitrophota bacterium]